MKQITILVGILMLGLGFSSFAQTIIWEENFNSYSNGTASSSIWSVNYSGTTSRFAVNNGRFTANNTSSLAIWSSELISIGNYSNVELNIDFLKSSNNDNTDYIKAYYSIDNATPVQFYSKNNDLSSNTKTISNLNGNSLQIIVECINNRSDEYYYFDNVLVTGTPIPVGLMTSSYSDITSNSFVANWSSVSNAISYYLDVFEFNPNQASSSVVSEGFENNMSLFSVSGTGSYYSGSSDNGDSPSNSPFYFSGSSSYGVNSSSATLTSNSINTTSYSDLTLNFRLAAFSYNNTTNGMESTDEIIVEISSDGGANYYNTLTVNGTSSSRWNFSASGVASTNYDGDASTVLFTQSSSYSSSSAGTITITDIPSTSNLKVRITMTNNYSKELWLIDDFEISGKAKTYVNGYNNKSLTGTNDTVFGLNPSSRYYFQVRAENSNNAIIGLSDTIIVTTYTMPLVDATDISANDLGYGIELNWSDGNGNGRLVKINTSNNFKKPKDRIDYSSLCNTEWQGNGEQYVYDGSSSSVLISGLDTVSTYYVAIYEYLIYNETSKANVKIYSPGVYSADLSEGVILPIELVVFEAKIENGKIIIDWSTASEINNDYFTLEKSINGIDFVEIGQVQGAGNSNYKIDYQFIDDSEISPIAYFRLKQTDFDGGYSLSQIIMVENSNQTGFELSNSWFSNENTLNIEVQSNSFSNINYQVLNMQGQMIVSSFIKIEEGNNSYSINLPNMTNGTYIIRVESNGVMAIRKVNL